MTDELKNALLVIHTMCSVQYEGCTTCVIRDKCPMWSDAMPCEWEVE